MEIRVVAAQFPVTLDIAQNLQCMLSLLRDVDAGELLVLPEGALSGYEDDISFLHSIDTDRLNEALDALEEAVRQNSTHLIFGSCLREGQQWVNAGLYFSPEGKRFVYRKINLATHEHGHFAAGAELPIFRFNDSKVKARIGIQLCREIRYPEQWRCLARQGADMLVYLTNAINPRQNIAVWRSHLISRAAENQRFVISANRAHQQQHCPTMIISPSGEVLQEVVSEKTEMLRCMLHLEDVANWYLDQCRTDVVSFSYKDPGNKLGEV